MRPLMFVRINDTLLDVIREFNPHYFLTDPKRPNWLNQKFIGLWVHHLDCDRVVRQDNKILICRTIEDAVIIEENEELRDKMIDDNIHEVKENQSS